MKANFNLGLTLEQREVTQKISINNVDDMDNKLFKEIYGILDSVNKRIQRVVDKYYGVPQDTTEGETVDPANENADDEK